MSSPTFIWRTIWGPINPVMGFRQEDWKEARYHIRGSKIWPPTTSARYETFQPEGPYQLGGWSMGGVVAFEMAQQLHAQGQQIGLLALLDARIPAADEEGDCRRGFPRRGC